MLLYESVQTQTQTQTWSLTLGAFFFFLHQQTAESGESADARSRVCVMTKAQTGIGIRIGISGRLPLRRIPVPDCGFAICRLWTLRVPDSPVGIAALVDDVLIRREHRQSVLPQIYSHDRIQI